tara:strand:+ start:3271 stop:4242 length:972 start_codon:yes stop_codon:yes gene_type:complete
VLIVTNEHIAPLYLEPLLQHLESLDKVETLILPAGEQYKNLASLELIATTLLKKNFGRDTTLIALGGGVIGDLTGFAASCYQRGTDFIQMPTTLLAQVDASVGGKTAINHNLGKNMLGAFYQPRAVLIDIATLNTLPEREFVSGLAEVVKYGAIWDQQFFHWLEAHTQRIIDKDKEALCYLIKKCCEIKAYIVEQDEREHHIRALLNFGHTFAHAIEAQTHYQQYLHGEAVAIGMCMAAQLSAHLDLISFADVERLRTLLKKLQIPLNLRHEASYDEYVTLMQRDKKNSQGSIHFVLLESLGKAKIMKHVPNNLLQQVIKGYT